MLAPKKSLGQNFLRDENIARKIVTTLGVTAGDVVVEIGPGQGDLTKYILQAGSTVIGIEIDHRAVTALQERFGSQLNLLERDVLQVQLHELSGKPGNGFVVVGNIPYYITSEILFWLYSQAGVVRHATMMMQLEVAERLVAEPRTKEYGILTVMTQYYSDTRLLFKVSRNSFHPRPQVDSAVVRFEFGKQSLPVDERLFKNIVRRTFGTRRKTLRNSLQMMGFADGALASVPFDLSQRPEQLPLTEFVRLTRILEPFADNLSLKF